jgi:hypothetical protein
MTTHCISNPELGERLAPTPKDQASAASRGGLGSRPYSSVPIVATHQGLIGALETRGVGSPA